MGDKISVILVDTKYFGQYFRKARRDLGIKSGECGHMFGLTQRQILRIECSKLLIPDRVLEKITANGMAMILCKRRK